MIKNGKIPGMAYEATLKEGTRIYRVFQEGKLLAEGNQKELPQIPRRFMDDGLNDIASDMIETLPNLSWCTCEICGEKFISGTGRTNIKTCSVECRKERHLEKKRKNKKHSKSKKLDFAAEAKRLNISYGQYSAIRYMKQIGMKNLPEIAKEIHC